MSEATREPTHGDLAKKIDQAIANSAAAEEKADEATRIAKANKERLDEIAGATKLGKWLVPIFLTAGALAVAVWQVLTGK